MRDPPVPLFSTVQHGQRIRAVGMPGIGDTTTIVGGSAEHHQFVATRTLQGRLVGAIAVNDPPALLPYRDELERQTASIVGNVIWRTSMTEPARRPPRPATVKAVRNGPLQLKGTFRLLDPDGEEYDLEGQRIVLLCRCGRSKNKPFCDSTHVSEGFVADDRPACQGSDSDSAEATVPSR